MFIEPHLNQAPAPVGWIEVICGAMFSGKTEELIRRIRRAKIAKQKVGIFKPAIDTRYHHEEVVSHNANSIPSVPVPRAEDILPLASEYEVVGIDEAQFFDEKLPRVATELANQGKRVIIAGLDMDYQGKPFGCMPELMAIAEFVTKVHAICVRCGALASYSFRKVAAHDTILLGETDSYEPRCRRCFLSEASREA
ncbi:MAG: thymidine kinase [Thermonema sp.]|jgi:thymidine kinase|uniref:thymidine kinase n=1 Tax=Thermonema sp. TaxID=2231181 RepID=UPI0021DE55D0|nr:thymidine kinase [Thermonema sp.]GIV40044.1 MAG: thymidine kinase [Thermonema sp.]